MTSPLCEHPTGLLLPPTTLQPLPSPIPIRRLLQLPLQFPFPAWPGLPSGNSGLSSSHRGGFWNRRNWFPWTRVLDWTQPQAQVCWADSPCPAQTNLQDPGCPLLEAQVAMATLCLSNLRGNNRKITVKTVLFCVPSGSHLSLPTPFDM